MKASANHVTRVNIDHIDVNECNIFIKSLKNLLEKEWNHQMVFVLFCGPYENGKSTRIAKLLDRKDIGIGDGMILKTKGFDFYEPISLNELRKRFKKEEIPNDDTCVIFIDSQGTDCPGQNQLPDELLYFISSLTNIAVTVCDTRVSRYLEDDPVYKMIKVVTEIHGKKGVFNLLSDLQQFSLGAFNDFAADLIDRIDKCKNEAFIDGEEVVGALKEFLKAEKKQNFAAKCKNILESMKAPACERYCNNIANKIMEELQKRLKNIHEQFLNDLITNEILEFPTYDEVNLIQFIDIEMEKRIPELIQKESVYKDKNRKIKDELKSIIRANQKEISQTTFEKQKNYMISKAKEKLEEIINKIKSEIQEYQDIPEINSKNAEKKIKKEIRSYLKNDYDNFKISNEIRIEIESQIEQEVSEKINDLQTFTFEKIYPSFVKSYIEGIDNKLNQNYLKYSLYNFEKFNEEFEEDFIRQIPKFVQENSLFKKIEVEFQNGLKRIYDKIQNNSEIYLNIINPIYEKEIENIKQKECIKLEEFFPSFDNILKNIFNEVDNYCERNSLSNESNCNIKVKLGEIIFHKNKELYDYAINIFKEQNKKHEKNKLIYAIKESLNKDLDDICEKAIGEMRKSKSTDIEEIMKNSESVPFICEIKRELKCRISVICKEYQLSDDDISIIKDEYSEKADRKRTSLYEEANKIINLNKSDDIVNEPKPDNPLECICWYQHRIESIFENEYNQIKNSCSTKVEEILQKDKIQSKINPILCEFNEFTKSNFSDMVEKMQSTCKSEVERLFSDIQKRAEEIAQKNASGPVEIEPSQNIEIEPNQNNEIEPSQTSEIVELNQNNEIKPSQVFAVIEKKQALYKNINSYLNDKYKKMEESHLTKVEEILTQIKNDINAIFSKGEFEQFFSKDEFEQIKSNIYKQIEDKANEIAQKNKLLSFDFDL